MKYILLVIFICLLVLLIYHLNQDKDMKTGFVNGILTPMALGSSVAYIGMLTLGLFLKDIK